MMNEKSRIVSALLIRKTAKPGVLSNHYHSFCLAIPEWCSCRIKIDESRQSLSLKRAHGNPVKENEKQQKENDRFSFDIDADDLSKYKKVVVCIIPRRLLCKFVSKTRKGDGKEYTPKNIYLLLACL